MCVHHHWYSSFEYNKAQAAAPQRSFFAVDSDASVLEVPPLAGTAAGCICARLHLPYGQPDLLPSAAAPQMPRLQALLDSAQVTEQACVAVAGCQGCSTQSPDGSFITANGADRHLGDAAVLGGPGGDGGAGRQALLQV